MTLPLTPEEKKEHARKLHAANAKKNYVPKAKTQSITKGQIARARKLVADTAAPAAELPAKPWLVDGAPTENGLLAIYELAVSGVPEKSIAGILGLEADAFKALQGKRHDNPPNAVRLALNQGDAESIRLLFNELSFRAYKLRDSQSLHFLARIKGFRESGAATEIKQTGQFIQILPPMSADETQRNIAHIQEQGGYALPGPHPTKEAYLASLGMTHIDDARDLKLIVSTMRDISGNTDEEITEYLRSVGRADEIKLLPNFARPAMIDVSPPKEITSPRPKPEPYVEPEPTGPTEADIRAHGFAMVQWQTNCENARKAGVPLPPQPAPLPEGRVTPAPKIDEPVRVELTPKNGQAIGPNFNRTASY